MAILSFSKLSQVIARQSAYLCLRMFKIRTKEIILHVGFHKTGTSALQKFFSNNRSLLAKHDVYYPPSLSFDAHHKYVNLLHNKHSSQIHNKNIKRLAQQFYKNTTCSKVLLSSEMFIEPMTAIEALKELPKYFSKIKVVYYYRSLPMLWESAYMQQVKQRLEPKLISDYRPYFLYPVNNSIANFMAIRDCEIIIRDYERIITQNVAIERDFCEHILAIHNIRISPKSKLTNRSLSREATLTLVYLRRTIDKNELLKIVKQKPDWLFTTNTNYRLLSSAQIDFILQNEKAELSNLDKLGIYIEQPQNNLKNKTYLDKEQYDFWLMQSDNPIIKPIAEALGDTPSRLITILKDANNNNTMTDKTIYWQSERKLILVGHDAFPHGAQVLLKYIIKTLTSTFNFQIQLILLRSGELINEYTEMCPVHLIENYSDLQMRDLCQSMKINGYNYAILNSVATGHIVKHFKRYEIESTCLIHELPDLIQDTGLTENFDIIMSHANHVIFPNEYVKDTLTNVFKLENIDPIIRGQGNFSQSKYVSIAQKQAYKTKLSHKLGFDDSSKVILAVGFGDERKGFDYWLEIAQLLLSKRDDLVFIWIGHIKHEYASLMENIIQNNSYKYKIFFTGKLFDTELYYSAADIYTLTSREDPFPSVVLEAMGYGLPIIAFDKAGGYCQLLSQTGNTLVPNFDTELYAKSVIDQLDNSDALAIQGKQNSDHIAIDYNFENYVAALAKYSGICLPNNHF